MRLVAGVDEAGRGPLAGPVVAAVVVLRDGQIIPGVRDSKKLSAAKRIQLVAAIHEHAIDWAIGCADVAEIDSLNILGGTMLAMRRAVEGLSVRPDKVRVDGNRRPDFPVEIDKLTETLVGGDDICPAIGAASILAKVERDGIMEDLHNKFPGYGFDRHKGYPTVAHREALAELGASPAHRISFRPVREAVEASAQRINK